MKVDVGSDQESDIWPHLVAECARQGSEFTGDKRCRSLVDWLINCIGAPVSTCDDLLYSIAFAQWAVVVAFACDYSQHI